ncbi:hypothetical protein NY2A_b038R [Paramecium bursaria Chlorella virus NY2A]|uniref:Uncharacterized protein b038R n=1 Tax=Paramecium bursaria Chlorella virus NY2A TaxID=46021 RepID=A7IVR3_PBCVN|nr:hypothetical protein NY2A_b038R [Paramecium bursaria Chlorella virus NY2A]YP_001498117.1 hypothetical protein AR158_C035R [Paramecium bursaria Chlorella virus AR158]ABT14437.1 hypothetical protein NY2A_b038R [Paramecium bursaria Chlorella virus NY2A]ABU43581.1 hypothetical protein AR158_C035R [Paramecium bursaria Chlorella virus AR158]
MLGEITFPRISMFAFVISPDPAMDWPWILCISVPLMRSTSPYRPNKDCTGKLVPLNCSQFELDEAGKLVNIN